jgi:2-methylisocitrate lyase-like PEP mutase family enzyme
VSAIKEIVAAVAPKPVNVLVGPSSGPIPWVELQKSGAKRISLGSALYSRLMGDLQQAATQLAAGDLAAATAGGMSYGELTKLVSPES